MKRVYDLTEGWSACFNDDGTLTLRDPNVTVKLSAKRTKLLRHLIKMLDGRVDKDGNWTVHTVNDDGSHTVLHEGQCATPELAERHIINTFGFCPVIPVGALK